MRYRHVRVVRYGLVAEGQNGKKRYWEAKKVRVHTAATTQYAGGHRPTGEAGWNYRVLGACWLQATIAGAKPNAKPAAKWRMNVGIRHAAMRAAWRYAAQLWQACLPGRRVIRRRDEQRPGGVGRFEVKLGSGVLGSGKLPPPVAASPTPVTMGPQYHGTTSKVRQSRLKAVCNRSHKHWGTGSN